MSDEIEFYINENGIACVPLKLYNDSLEEIERLNKKIKQYEDSEDLTLFYMWLDGKAKDKMKKLQEDNEYLNKCNIELARRNTKAIEYINNYLPNYDFDKTNLKELLNILRGSDKEC